MAKRPTTDPALRDLKQELLRTTDALKDAYTRFNCVCDSELIEASIYEISALKARCNYLLRRILFTLASIGLISSLTIMLTWHGGSMNAALMVEGVYIATALWLIVRFAPRD